MRYFFLTLKKIFTSLPSLLFALFVCAITAVLFLNFNSEKLSTLPIGLVSESEDAYIDVAATLLSESESFEIIKLEKEEAERLLAENKIQGYAYLPENFVNKATQGKNIPFTYTLLKKPSDFSQVLTSDIVSTVSVVLTESQNSVYGMRQYLKDSGQKNLLSEKTNELSAKLVLNILNRKNLFKNEESGVVNSVSTSVYYISAFTLLFALISGIILSPKMIKTNMALYTLMSLRSISFFKQILSEWFALFVTLWLFTSPFILFLSDFALLFTLIPALLLVSAFLVFLWELSNSLVGGILLTFFVTVISAFLSGFFYPSYLLPDIITDVAKCLPIGVAFTYTQKAFSRFELNLLPLLISLFALLALTLIIRKKRIERGHI